MEGSELADPWMNETSQRMDEADGRAGRPASATLRGLIVTDESRDD